METRKGQVFCHLYYPDNTVLPRGSYITKLNPQGQILDSNTGEWRPFKDGTDDGMVECAEYYEELEDFLLIPIDREIFRNR